MEPDSVSADLGPGPKRVGHREGIVRGELERHVLLAGRSTTPAAVVGDGGESVQREELRVHHSRGARAPTRSAQNHDGWVRTGPGRQHQGSLEGGGPRRCQNRFLAKGDPLRHYGRLPNPLPQDMGRPAGTVPNERGGGGHGVGHILRRPRHEPRLGKRKQGAAAHVVTSVNRSSPQNHRWMMSARPGASR